LAVTDPLFVLIQDYIQKRDSSKLAQLLSIVETSGSPQKRKVQQILLNHKRKLEAGEPLERAFHTLCYDLVNETELDDAQSAAFLEEASQLSPSLGNPKQLLVDLRNLVFQWSLAGQSVKARVYLAKAIEAETRANNRKPPLGRCSHYRKSDLRCKKYLSLGLICPYNARKSFCKRSPKSHRKTTKSKNRSIVTVLAADVLLAVAANLLSGILLQWSLTQDLAQYVALNTTIIILSLIVAWYLFAGQEAR